MPGPGGGARGGGGGRGGSFGGGGFGGGGFGGGRPGGRPGPRPRGGGFHRPPFMPFGYGGFGRPYHHGGGCFGSFLGILVLPIVLAIALVVMLISFSVGAIDAARQGGIVEYDENKFQDYADSCYAAEFGMAGAYEDYLLIAVLVDPDGMTDYNYIAWVGDHIDTEINYMMGGNDTALGRAMAGAINQKSYKYSLDSNLASVMDIMSQQIQALGLEDSFICIEEHNGVSSHLTNKSALSLTESTVNDALEDFTEETGITVVIVVDEMEDVFGRTMPAEYIVPIVIMAIILVVIIVLIIKGVRRRKSDPDDPDRYNQNRKNNRY